MVVRRKARLGALAVLVVNGPRGAPRQAGGVSVTRKVTIIVTWNGKKGAKWGLTSAIRAYAPWGVAWHEACYLIVHRGLNKASPGPVR